jgi:hypothetical protein
VKATLTLPHFDGWHLLGAYPNGAPDDVGSWLLHHRAEALLLELPEGLDVKDVQRALHRRSVVLRYITVSHSHEDHLDRKAHRTLTGFFPTANFIHPRDVEGDRLLHLGGEPLWLIEAPKHSLTDVVTVFRGVAMTGDIELGMLGSVNNEVSLRVKRASMKRLRNFEARSGYHVHSIVSAHLNDVRQGINWPDLFEC